MDEMLVPILLSAALGVSLTWVIWSLFRYPAPTETPLHRRFAVAIGADSRDTILEQPLLAPLVHMATACARRLNIGNLRTKVRTDLEASGNPNNYSVDEYLAICLMSSVGLVLASSAVSMVLSGLVHPLVVLFMGGLGFAAPLISLSSAARSRMMRISKQLPYTLDLIALMMAAGATFTEAVETLIRDNPEDDLNQELRLVQTEIDLGSKRAEALDHMADRIPLESLRSVIGAVNQAELLGTPLATILKSQADMMRVYRHVRAEKLSASASLRILFPSMLILLAVVLFVFGPWIIRAYRGELMQ